jgi:phosphoglycerate dehydrogenase-like enzyme
MKIVVTSIEGQIGAEQDFIDELRGDFSDVDIVSAANKDEQRREIADADVFCGWPAREVFLAAQKLDWLHCPGAGVDQLTQIPELINSDITLTNSRGPHAPPMADHVIGMMINLAHRWKDLYEDQSNHDWGMAKYKDKYVQIKGGTMGILSMGDIGTDVASRAKGFGMEVYGVDKFPKPSPVAKEVWGLDKLDDLIKMSDWFVVTAPLTPDTRGMIDRRQLGLMKDGSHIIIISRGHIVDEDALLAELQSGRLGGAGIDAFAQEPLPKDSPFWDLDNIVISPHASAYIPELVSGRRAIFKENLRRYLAGESFLYTVDKKAGF